MSTPIETNTEELQEILQTVYNLPNAGGGSSEPDLVIGFDDTNWDGITGPDQFTFDQTAVVSTYNKLLSGETVNCVLNAIYWPNSGGYLKASSPHVTAFAVSEAGNSARVGYMRVFFSLWREVSPNGYWVFMMEFSVLGNDTVNITDVAFRGLCAFTSSVY